MSNQIPSKLSLYKDFETHDKGVDQGIQMMNSTVYVLAHHLKPIKDERLYLALGEESGIKSWAGYVASKGLAMPTVDKYIGLYEVYILKLGKKPEELLGVSIYNMQLCKHVVEEAEEKDQVEWWGKITTLSAGDLIRELEEKKLKAPSVLMKKKCEKCRKVQVYYNQDKICTCKGFHAIFAQPVEQ